MPFQLYNRDSRVLYPTSGLTARAVAAAPSSLTVALKSSLAIPTFVDFSSIVQGELGGATTSASPPSTSSLTQSGLLNASQSATSNITTTESKGLPVGVIVGGSIGGLAIVLMSIILLVSVQRGRSRMRNAMGRTTPMTNFKDRPHRSTEIVPFEDEPYSNTTNLQSSHSASDQSSKPLQVQNASGFGHQHVGIGLPNINNAPADGKRQITATGGGLLHDSSPGTIGAQNRETEQNPFIAEDSPPSYQTASGLT